MNSADAPSYSASWVSRSASPVLSGAFYFTQALLAYSVYRDWVWLSIPLVILASHLMHGLLIAFHEASHGLLRKNRLLNDFKGVLVGVLSLTSFTLYRALHQKHHVNLASREDVELWPFVDVNAPLWGRRLAAFCELTLGLFFTPFLFWRNFFTKSSAIRNPRVRSRIWLEFAMAVGFWVIAISTVIHFNLWPWFFWNYFIPAFVAGNLQSWRKYIEHVGLSGHTARSATRSIVADTWGGRLVSVTLLHEPLHGIHHIKSGLPHYELPGHIDWLEPSESGDTRPFPNYRSAFADLLRRLADPRVGQQWEVVEKSSLLRSTEKSPPKP